MSHLQHQIESLTQGLIQPDGPDHVRSAVVAVDWIGHGHATAAAGIARADSTAPMRPDTQFHIASVGKPMTAALIVRAVEANKLGADGVDTRLIDTGALPPDICRHLHRIDGVSHGADITLRHLLTHTSGLRDAQIDDGTTTSEGYGGRYAPGSIVGSRAEDYRTHLAAIAAGRTPDPALVTRKLLRPWDPDRPTARDAGLINFYLNGGMAERALFPPGQAFHYSDTAFTLLAIVAEHLFGASYHRLLRTHLFDPLGMHDSFLHGCGDLDPAPWRREISDCWAGDPPSSRRRRSDCSCSCSFAATSCSTWRWSSAGSRPGCCCCATAAAMTSAIMDYSLGSAASCAWVCCGEEAVCGAARGFAHRRPSW